MRAVRTVVTDLGPRSFLALAFALATGCSLWNAPDRSHLDGGPRPDVPVVDAGTDAPIEVDAPDAPPPDAPDAPDAPPPRFELDCGDGMDDDGDGFIDCADLDCAADVVRCCAGGGTPVVNENWTTAGLAGWLRLPDLLDDGPNPPSAGLPLSQFSRGNAPYARAIIHDPAGSATGCIAIDPGVVITTSLRLTADSVPSCPTAECDERAGILLTAVQPATALASYSNGDVLPDELGVRMRRSATGEATVETTVAGNVVHTLADFEDSAVVQVRIELVPGVSEDGTPVSVTTVFLTPSGGAATTRALDREPAIARSLLLGPASGCAGGRGLYLAVEGVGNRVGVGTLQVTPQVCPNPNHFRALGPPLEAAGLGATAAWTTGGVGAPSIFYADANPTPGTVTPRWDVLFDASDRNRANETFATVRFAVGGAFFGDEAWTMLTARRAGAPLVHDGFPTCGGTCTESNRDPDLWLQTDADRQIVGSTGWVVWSRRLMSGYWELLIDTLELTSAAQIGSPAVVLSTDPAAGAATVSACTALRSPSLVGRPGGGLWLFFVCEHGGMPGDVRVADVSALTGALEMLRLEPVLTRGTAPYATLGIQDVDAEVWVRAAATTNEEVVLRLWFVSRSGGLPVVGLAEGVSHAVPPATSAGIPMLSMFAGNPVLLSRDERLPTCVGLCRITSVAAARSATRLDDPDVRFLVARSDEAAGAPRHLLIPLEQTLPLR